MISGLSASLPARNLQPFTGLVRQIHLLGLRPGTSFRILLTVQEPDGPGRPMPVLLLKGKNALSFCRQGIRQGDLIEVTAVRPDGFCTPEKTAVFLSLKPVLGLAPRLKSAWKGSV
ncbi:MAG: hypothetical protein LBK52_00610 [Deltaproteobacteria bacterium]|jgi:hypothetical protein|nr:hypothetical protein [Deltaproteobacteria bacterium]